ncbi:DUF885 domain-containing protein [Opitutus sp. GAS368]|uniref:DUF885 domain-containing protein n=1 Tax=Opitutus sp. GAS368 TaxID=1882749 RepID=UPI00087DE995|nr:DUF885 domain-containing protein [Opitutus sp. GAS368]SDR69576.1 protein of unknown function [Opitutus sp. GAS368]
MNRYIPAILRSAGLLLGAAFLTAPALAGTADTPAWIEKSNANAKVVLDATNHFSPEAASSTGIPGFDDKVADLGPGINERTDDAIISAREELKKRMMTETDALVRQDLEILIQSCADTLETNRLQKKHLARFIDVGQLIFFGEFGLLQDQVDAARRPAALARLKLYTGLMPGSTPITQLARDRYNEAAADPAHLGSFKDRIQQSISNTARYVTGIRGLYAKYGLDKLEGAPAALDALEKQLKDYNEWATATVLPRARTDFRLPAELYADNLKNVGLDIPPQELMQKAFVAFGEIRNAMQALAPLVAKEHGFADSDYRAVLRSLKKDQLPKDQVEPYYHEIIGRIEDLIRREHIVTLPERAMIMRLASEAENAAQPAPHMQPPPLINNKGERGQFVLTTGNPPMAGGKTDGYDDFTFKAAAWTLTAHEGRPGHELQFSAMVERGVSQARSLFAFNSVNVEGWALYSEAEMQPYEPIDAQLITLQLRLQRAARAFLDPMLNLGLISRERAHDILIQEVGLSEAFARSELDRYTFRSPGQATAYFYGYLKLMELRTATEVALGPKFNRQAFNDYIIGQGLLPPQLLAKAVREDFIPVQLKK